MLSCIAGVVLSNWIISLREDRVSVRVLSHPLNTIDVPTPPPPISHTCTSSHIVGELSWLAAVVDLHININIQQDCIGWI